MGSETTTGSALDAALRRDLSAAGSRVRSVSSRAHLRYDGVITRRPRTRRRRTKPAVGSCAGSAAASDDRLCLRIVSAELLLEVAPCRLGPAIGADDPGGGAGVHPASSASFRSRSFCHSSLAKPRLLRTVTSCSATSCFSHSSSAQRGRCTVPGGNAAPSSGRPLEPQEPVGLGLEGRARHGPEPGAAAEPLAALGRRRHRSAPRPGSPG